MFVPSFSPGASFPEDVQVYLWEIEEPVADLEALLPNRSLLTIPPYSQFNAVSRKREWLAVRALLAKVLPADVTIQYTSTGRPYLQPSVASCSVSHTKGFAALALSDAAVGMDIEQISSRALSLVDHFLQTDELPLLQVPEAEVLAVLLWSAKESVYKLYDIPGLELKSDISLHCTGQGNPWTFSVEVTGADRASRVWGQVFPEFVLTVATFV